MKTITMRLTAAELHQLIEVTQLRVHRMQAAIEVDADALKAPQFKERYNRAKALLQRLNGTYADLLEKELGT